MKGSIPKQVDYLWSFIDGIGESKRVHRINSGFTNATGDKNVSPLVHSGEYKDEVLKTFRNLFRFAKREFEIKDIELIDIDIITEWIMEKAEDGVVYRSLSTYLGHINKLHDALMLYRESRDRDYSKILFKKIEVERLRKHIKEVANSYLKTNRAYIYPNKVISLLPYDCYISARLQLECGLRVKEATVIKLEQLNGDSTITISGKGGRRLAISPKQELFERLKKRLKEGNGFFKIPYSTYLLELKKSVLVCNDRWSGTHAFRYNFAQNEYRRILKEKIENLGRPSSLEDLKKLQIEAMTEVSKKLGHNRHNITGGYL